jgi:hypothetical protein
MKHETTDPGGWRHPKRNSLYDDSRSVYYYSLKMLCILRNRKEYVLKTQDWALNCESTRLKKKASGSFVFESL